MKNILKGLLLWSTAIAVVIFLGSVDSIKEFSTFLVLLSMTVILLLLCKRFINYDEACKLTGANLLHKWLDK